MIILVQHRRQVSVLMANHHFRRLECNWSKHELLETFETIQNSLDKNSHLLVSKWFLTKTIFDRKWKAMPLFFNHNQVRFCDCGIKKSYLRGRINSSSFMATHTTLRLHFCHATLV